MLRGTLGGQTGKTRLLLSGRSSRSAVRSRCFQVNTGCGFGRSDGNAIAAEASIDCDRRVSVTVRDRFSLLLGRERVLMNSRWCERPLRRSRTAVALK
ncbi:hypothetical protein CKA32_005197 [Geitlerinema sp. FC II]|nr:hypothetical protein CKA32_005197 [Geitlerinema sp. FC II]